MYTRILYLSFQFIWNLKRKYDLYKKLFTKLKKNNLKSMKRSIMHVTLILVCDLFNYTKLTNTVYVDCHIFRNRTSPIKITCLLTKGHQGAIKIENNIIVMTSKCINCTNPHISCWFSQL